MLELNREQYADLLDCLSYEGSIEPRAILTGNNPGRVFVDPTLSGCGLVWSAGLEGFYVVGKPRVAVSFLELKNLSKLATKLGLSWLEISADTAAWEPTMKAKFSCRTDNELSWQHVYTAEPSSIAPMVTVHESLRLVPLADILTGKLECDHRSFVVEKIAAFWRQPEDYCRLGIGWCALLGNRLLRVCFSGFVHKSTHGIDIEVLPEYRSQGIGRTLAGQFLKECKEKTITPWWDCMESNIRSVALARSVGLRLYRRYDLWTLAYRG